MAEVAPVSVEPSGDFLGHDGEWSVFNIRVGIPPRSFKVLASTQIPETWLVDPQGCTAKDPANCTDARGGAYRWTESSERENHAVVPLEAQRNLGMTGKNNGDYGYDIMGLGRPGNGNITLTNKQVVAAVATKDFFLGYVGLAERQVGAARMGKPPGLLTSLNDENHIPSRSYGYTAGAAYRRRNASLTFGGFDRSKLLPNDVEFSLAKPDTRELMVELQSIVSADAEGNETPLLVQKIPMLLDSTVPHIWLPLDTCERFERAFGLVYDADANFYFVDQDLHDELTKKIANITFALAPSDAGGPVVNINLPYASFDLNVNGYHPKVTNATKYFPLRQARNESQYTLGRAFFQESYLTVNYETRKFSVSQARHDPDELSNIVAIPSAQATGTESEPTDPGSVPRPPYTVVTPTAEKSRALGTPAIAGIAVAVVVLALLTGGIVLWVCRRKRKARALRDKAERPFDHPAPHDARELDGSGRPDPRKAGPDVTVAEKEQSRIDQREVLLMDHGNNRPVVELASPELLPSELPSHGTANRFELPSSEPVHRSELSTPEPVARSELSTPEPEWPASFEREDGTVGEPSPPLGMDLSPISAPGSLWSGNRRRQPHLRMNSSESDGGWPRAGTPPSSPPSSRPPLRHSRMISSDSESSFHPDRASSGSLRPTQVRMDSSDSEVGVKRATFSSVRRPHRRLDSNDSDTTMDARLALNSSISFSPPQPSHDRHVQGIPSLGPEPSLFSLSSPSLESMKSGLVSPTPLEDVDEGEARDYPNPEWRRGNRG